MIIGKPYDAVRLSDELVAVIGPGHSISADGQLTLAPGQSEALALTVIAAHNAIPAPAPMTIEARLDALLAWLESQGTLKDKDKLKELK